jgi:HKD family nuclease
MKKERMKLIKNTDEQNHLEVIIANLKRSNEAYIAIAFLKESGLNKLFEQIKTFLKLEGRITIIAGQNFAFTEPKALHSIRNLLEKYKHSKLYLVKAESRINVFHPKLYLFRKDDDCCVISGSANLTAGGLTSNHESSLLVNCNVDSELWKDSVDYINFLTSSELSDEATLLVIKQYETFYKEQKQHNKRSKAYQSKNKSRRNFNYHFLVDFFNTFDNDERGEYFEEKKYAYNQAKIILNKIAKNSELKQIEFEGYLDSLVVGDQDEFRYWHSGSLYRLRRSVFPHFKKFQELVRFIKDHKNRKPEFVFPRAMEIVKDIEGASVNYVTEIMMTYNPVDFANMNKNPLTVLRKEGGLNIKATPTSYSGLDYKEYCEIIKEISQKLNLKNMLEADSFFNDIYWKIK